MCVESRVVCTCAHCLSLCIIIQERMTRPKGGRSVQMPFDDCDTFLDLNSSGPEVVKLARTRYADLHADGYENNTN